MDHKYEIEPYNLIKYSPTTFEDLDEDRDLKSQYLSCKVVSKIFRHQSSTLFLVKDAASDSNRVLRVQYPKDNFKLETD